ncbi:uncharacterized protein LOC129737798 [Uranotaenia lowii]|uniref:uncharacterized protein LOC129737798 n=1 Tax=Uranotaenia lowii TaxID=190385 RepID=UPI002478ED30|nr:uncharacterized protein LOC129737798 [Uranotaenia lowii]
MSQMLRFVCIKIPKSLHILGRSKRITERDCFKTDWENTHRDRVELFSQQKKLPELEAIDSSHQRAINEPPEPPLENRDPPPQACTDVSTLNTQYTKHTEIINTQ